MSALQKYKYLIFISEHEKSYQNILTIKIRFVIDKDIDSV